MTQPIKIIHITSISYSGTTWINLVLASHPQTFMVGPPDRIWKLDKTDAHRACLIHDRDCTFWPGFLSEKRGGPFFERLAHYSGKTVFIINNPTNDFLEHEILPYDFDYRLITAWRDPRGVLTSALRHQPERFPNLHTAISDWLLPGLLNVMKKIRGSKRECLPIHYENLIKQPQATLKSLENHLGLLYKQDPFRYWEYEHHLTAGNTGSIHLLRKLQGLHGYDHHRAPYYDELLSRITHGDFAPRIDDSWERLMTRNDLLAYDALAGNMHQDLGYKRDEFSDQERLEYLTTRGPARAAVDTQAWWRNRDETKNKTLFSKMLHKVGLNT